MIIGNPKNKESKIMCSLKKRILSMAITNLQMKRLKKVKSNFWQTWEYIYSETGDNINTLYFGGNTK